MALFIRLYNQIYKNYNKIVHNNKQQMFLRHAQSMQHYSETEPCGTAASDGPTVPATDDR